jgi:hypothetical protein
LGAKLGPEVGIDIRPFTVPTTEVMGYFILPSRLWGCLFWIGEMGGYFFSRPLTVAARLFALVAFELD